ncbi:MAG: hypothetical protein LBV69_00680 [Bacteroidales bacterium]|jgi:hypothetical protein|nr:hypothetical protein [Bacteroidales bacterium]
MNNVPVSNMRKAIDYIKKYPDIFIQSSFNYCVIFQKNNTIDTIITLNVTKIQ